MGTLLVRGILPVALLLGVAFPAWAQDSKGVGVVTALTGRVDLKRPQAPEAPLKLRDNLFVRDVVDTQKESLARVLLLGKSTVTVRELSRFEIREEVRPDGGHRALINLAEGKIRVMVARRLMKPGDEVEIRTPNAIAAVRGSDGVIEVSRLPDGRPQTVITGVSGEFELTLPATPPFIARGKEFLDGPAHASRSPLIAMAEQVSDAAPSLRVASSHPTISLTGGNQFSGIGQAGAVTWQIIPQNPQQINNVTANYQIKAPRPLPSSTTTDHVLSAGQAAATTATLASGAQPRLAPGGGPLVGAGGGRVNGPPITPLTVRPLTTQAGGNGVTVVPFTGSIIASQVFELTFSSAPDVKAFQVITSGTTWFVSVKDCCIAGDKWKAEISRSGTVLTSVTGNGSITAFSDPVGVSSTGAKTFDVKVTYTSGTDLFPAGMSTKFDTTKGSITVTPK